MRRLGSRSGSGSGSRSGSKSGSRSGSRSDVVAIDRNNSFIKSSALGHLGEVQPTGNLLGKGGQGRLVSKVEQG